MDKMTIYAVIAGLILYVLTIGLRYGGYEGPQIILFFITPFIVGMVAAGLKRGFTLAFVLSFVFGTIINTVVASGSFDAVSDLDRLTAVLLFSLIASLIAGALGAVGGLLGTVVFKKKGQKTAQAP